MSDSDTARPEAAGSRLSTVVTVLIALVSTVIALVASQAATASGNATEAQHNGVIAKINLERTDGGSWAQIARSRRAFNTYRFNRRLYDLTFDYIAQAESQGSSPQGTRLRLEAAGQLEESNLAYNFTDAGYLLQDEAGNYTDFDVDNYLNDQRQVAAIYQDIDYDDNFADAAVLRRDSLALNISVLFWFIALLFFTWAEITRSWLRWLWLGAGVLVSLGILAAYVLNGLSAALGLA
jgi:hypothetical protein